MFQIIEKFILFSRESQWISLPKHTKALATILFPKMYHEGVVITCVRVGLLLNVRPNYNSLY